MAMCKCGHQRKYHAGATRKDGKVGGCLACQLCKKYREVDDEVDGHEFRPCGYGAPVWGGRVKSRGEYGE